MNIHSPTPGVIETDIQDEDVERISPEDSPNDIVPIKMSRSLKAAYRCAKKSGEAQDVKSRRICATLRAKRDGTDHPFKQVIIEESATKVQTSLSDF